eukprot:TRINITY_DN1253_c0_g1_i1.p1 TRINITY_DN1253_c0_g1~~TRINITY_DN1253_c0_g1_i1.p1  ORF type:complete len:716 (-),score=176.17 TRINITY_DN1253_c0_g1_i1:361-2508(-)
MPLFSSPAGLSRLISSAVRASPIVHVRLFYSTTAAASSSPSSSTERLKPKNNPWFDKILVANRGEIACRVMRTAKKMGIKTVAIYSTADEFAQHVKMADEAYCVGPPQTAKSYLNMERIIEVIRESGAQAVHPGYGFLSENTVFAKKLEDIGVAFIGPDSHAIHAMGDKIESKKLAAAAKVNSVPGVLAEIDDPQEVLKIAKDIGYPIMIKASAGGGGKGMRVAWNDAEALEGFRLSKSEAKSSFGDDRVFVEKFIDNPRHIEVQIIADSHGNTIYLPERECSIQRRNQKIIEEAPSSFIDPDTRRKMGLQAAALARAVGYKSAGTVEFLVDSKRNFYFLEMNTRLQVEHPITECVTKLDLVEQMIRVAAGEKLAFSQDDIKIHGWAFETRVYAEDPYRNFLPSIGRLSRYIEPKGEHVRIDTGVIQGSDISIYYDPMICKLITTGDNRDQARLEMVRALDSYVIRGVTHNIPILRDMLTHPEFAAGDFSTKFIPKVYPGGFKGKELSESEKTTLSASTAAVALLNAIRDSTISGRLSTSSPVTKRDYIVTTGGEEVPITISAAGDNTYIVESQGKRMTVKTDWKMDTPIVELTINGEHVIIQVPARINSGYKVIIAGNPFDVTVRTTREQALSKFMPVKKVVDTSKMLLSPMPGVIFSVAVKPGDKIQAQQELVVVEAMKMQNVLRAERDGIVKDVKFKAGTNVAADDILITFE